MEIGDLNSDLYFKYANNIYIKKKGSTNEYIQFFDSEGNPNIKLKNPISAKDPYSTESSDGFYYYDNKLYIKIGNNVIDLSLQGSSLPEGSIIMYKGTSAPEGWSDYGGDTGISGVIYITNGNSTRDRITIELSIIGLNNNTATVGSEYTLQAIIKKDGQSYSNYNANEITYSTNDTEYATINGSKITPKKYKDGGVTISASIAESSVHTGASTSKTIVIARKTLNSFSFSTTLGEITAGSSLDLKNYITGLDNNLKNSLQFVIGNLTVNISLLVEGDYTIKAKLPQTDVYLAAESTNSFALKVKSATKPQPNISFNGNEGHANARGEGISTPTLINPNNVTVTYSSSNTSVATVDNNGNIDVVGVGTTIITATFAGNDLYSPQSVSYTLIIGPKVINNPIIKLSQDEFYYDGTEKRPTVIVKDGETIISSTEYTVSYDNNINVGTAIVIITDKEGGDYVVNGTKNFYIVEEEHEDEEDVTASVNIVPSSIYDEGGSSVDTENIKIVVDDLRSDKTNNIVKVLVNVIGEPQVQINVGSDLSNINGNALKGKTSALYENETYTVIRVCDSTFQEGLIDAGGFYDVPNTGVTRGHLFKGGDCLTITILNNLGNSATITENTSSQSISDKNIVVTVKNNTENDLVLNGIIKFHGSGLDTDNNIKFSNSNVVINSGSIFTSVKIKIDANYRGRTLNKIIIYDSNNTPIEIGDLNTTLQMGATYNIIYGEIKVNPGNADTFDTVISKFNSLDPLKNKEIEKNSQSTGNIYNYLEDMYNKAVIEYNDSNSILFKLETYPDIYTNSEYRGNNSEYEGGLALNAMTYWLMAMCLTELLASKNNDSNFDISTATNNQTKFFKLAYDLGNEDGYGKSIPLYRGFTLKGDPNICRLAASAVYAMYRGENNGQHTYSEISGYRNILGGSVLEAPNLSELNFTTPNNPIWFIVDSDKSTDCVDCDWDGNKASRTVTKLGYAVNTYNIFPNSPGPRIPNTSVLDLDLPQNQGQDSSLFNSNTNNYIIDEHIDNYICENYNIMDYEKKSLWDSYSTDLKNRLIKAVASMSCSRKSMFCEDIKISEMNEPWVEYDPSEYGNKDTNCGKYIIHRFKKNSNGDLTLSSPFGINSNLYRDWVDKTNNLNNVERYINCVTDFADNMRFPTFCPNTGRRRPGDGNEVTNEQGRGGKPGDYRNELYNLDISEMVVDTYAQLAKTGFGKENGYAQQAPHSYPSGHSAQIWALALALTSANPKDILTYLKGAYEYSINRTICRCHWNSDIIYGRLFGTITIPIINIVSSIKDGYDDMKSYIENGNVDPPSSSAEITFNITNTSGSSISCSGRMGVILSGAGFIHPIDKKEYVYYRISKGQCELWNLDSGQSLSVTVSFINDGDYESWMNNFNFANEDECAAGGRKSNVAFYDEYGVSHRLTPVNPANIAIGGTYNVEYNSNIHNSPSFYNDQGEEIPGYDWGGGTWND